MKQKIILKLASVEVLQNENGTVQFATDNPANAMLELTGKIFELEAQLINAKTKLLFAENMDSDGR